jgi:hypothetical protein
MTTAISAPFMVVSSHPSLLRRRATSRS